MTPLRASLRIGLTITFLLSLPGAYAEKTVYPELGVTVFAPAEAHPGVRRLVEACQDIVQKYFGTRASQAPPPMIFLYYDSAEPPSATGPASLTLSGTMRPAVVIHRIARKLLARTAVEHGVANPDEDHLEALAAGVTCTVLSRRSAPVAGYPASHRPVYDILHASDPPSAQHLLAMPVPPEYHPAYTLYSVYCRSLLEILRASKQINGWTAATALLLQLAEGKDYAASLEDVVTRYFGTHASLRQWFREEARRHDSWSRGHLSATQVVARLNKILILDVVLPAENGSVSVQRIPIGEIGEWLADYPPQPSVFPQKEKQLIELITDAPKPLQPALKQYLAILRTLRRKNYRRIGHQVEKADRTLADGLAQQLQIEAYVNTIERKAVPPEIRFADYIEVVEQYRDRRRRLSPEINDYLDSLSKEK